MKYLLTLMGLTLSLIAHADQVFTNYEDYYRQLRGMVFSEKPLQKSNDGYSFKGEHGLCGEEDSCQDYHGKLGSKKITISTSLKNGAFKINNHQFNYQSARKPLGSEKLENDAPLYVDAIYIAPNIKNRPEMICIEGHYAGTSSKYNYTEVFLIENGSMPFSVELDIKGICVVARRPVAWQAAKDLMANAVAWTCAGRQ